MLLLSILLKVSYICIIMHINLFKYHVINILLFITFGFEIDIPKNSMLIFNDIRCKNGC